MRRIYRGYPPLWVFAHAAQTPALGSTPRRYRDRFPDKHLTGHRQTCNRPDEFVQGLDSGGMSLVPDAATPDLRPYDPALSPNAAEEPWSKNGSWPNRRALSPGKGLFCQRAAKVDRMDASVGDRPNFSEVLELGSLELTDEGTGRSVTFVGMRRQASLNGGGKVAGLADWSSAEAHSARVAKSAAPLPYAWRASSRRNSARLPPTGTAISEVHPENTSLAAHRRSTGRRAAGGTWPQHQATAS